MFSVVCKDPFEAERVGERRARKIKESNEAIESINDALSNLSVSGRTTETSGVFSSSSSSRSSRTSIVGLGSRADSTSLRPKSSPAWEDGHGESKEVSASSRKRYASPQWKMSVHLVLSIADSGVVDQTPKTVRRDGRWSALV